MIKRGLRLITGNRDFGLLMGVQFLAQAGDGIVQGALGKLITFGGSKGFDLENADPEVLLSMVLVVMVPYTVLSPFVGVVIDRWDRRRLLLVANAARAIVVALLAAALAAGLDERALAVFAVFLLTLVATRVVLATKAAAIPVTVDRGSLMDANSVSQLGGALFQLGGFAVALVGSAVVSVWPLITIGALVYAAGAAIALGIRRVGEVREVSTLRRELGRVVARIVAGLKEVARTPKAGAAISTYFWLRLVWSYTLVGIGIIARTLIAEEFTASLLIGGAGAAGAVTGFLSSQRLLTAVRTSAHLVIASSLVAGAAVTVLGGIETALSIALLAFFLGFGFFLGKISLDTMVQEALGDGFRGRAFALYDIAYNLAWVVAAAAMKMLWTDDAQGMLIAGMGVVFLAGIAALSLWYRRAGLLQTVAAPETVRS